MTYDGSVFVPDMAGAIVVPAHPTNLMHDRVTGEIKPVNHPKVNVFHTPQEPADAREYTPLFFQDPDRDASTHYYTSGGVGTYGDGDLYQLVPECYGAIANGVRNKPYPPDTDPNINLNYQSRSNEIEGYAATVAVTCPRGCAQWNTVARWALAGFAMHGIPLDRAHNIGHYEVADDRTDPGGLDIGGIVADAVALLAAWTNFAEVNNVPDLDFRKYAKVAGICRHAASDVLQWGKIADPNVRAGLVYLMGPGNSRSPSSAREAIGALEYAAAQAEQMAAPAEGAKEIIRALAAGATVGVLAGG